MAVINSVFFEIDCKKSIAENSASVLKKKVATDSLNINAPDVRTTTRNAISNETYVKIAHNLELNHWCCMGMKWTDSKIEVNHRNQENDKDI